MKVLRAHIKGWTASYRFPPFVMVQPSLPIPPLSTCYGILSAACGRDVGPQETRVGFVAPYQGRGTDLERIFQVGKSGFVEKTNVVQREFICNPELYLYLDNLNLKEPLKRPRYPILLGRSSDLAFVENVNEVNLDECDEAYFQFTLLPFPFKGLATPIYALPVAFRGMVSRRPVKVSGFHIIETPPVLVRGSGILLDPEKRWGVFLHDSLCKVEQGALADSHRTLP